MNIASLNDMPANGVINMGIASLNTDCGSDIFVPINVHHSSGAINPSNDHGTLADSTNGGGNMPNDCTVSLSGDGYVMTDSTGGLSYDGDMLTDRTDSVR